MGFSVFHNSFDICFLNDIAVANSGLLHQYSLVDPRVRDLMMSVKQWAKEYHINSAKDNFISSYTWMNLVIFYLQCIGFLPNLQSPLLMEEAGLVPDPQRNYWHSVNSLDTCTLKWHDLKRKNLWIMPHEFDNVPLAALLYGFYEFYGYRFPWTFAVSIKQGRIVISKLATPKVCFFFSIEDPFETYDSHCPHDLGMPANEVGSPFIMECLRSAEKHLLKLVSRGESMGQKLWPLAPFMEPEPTMINGKKKQVWKQFENKGKKPNRGKGKQGNAAPNGNKNKGGEDGRQQSNSSKDNNGGSHVRPKPQQNKTNEPVQKKQGGQVQQKPARLHQKKQDGSSASGGAPKNPDENIAQSPNRPKPTKRGSRGRRLTKQIAKTDNA
jgi:Cid1 family poly A polymerase